MKRKRRLQVRLFDDDEDRIKVAAHASGLSVADHVRTRLDLPKRTKKATKLA